MKLQERIQPFFFAGFCFCLPLPPAGALLKGAFFAGAFLLLDRIGLAEAARGRVTEQGQKMYNIFSYIKICHLQCTPVYNVRNRDKRKNHCYGANIKGKLLHHDAIFVSKLSIAN